MSSRAIERERQALIDKYNAQAGRVNGVTTEQAQALQGTSGAPDDTNRYVTELDAADFVTGPASAVDNNLAQFNGITGKIVEDSGLSNANVSSAVSLKHAIQHAITATADHTSTATSGQMLKADANGLPVDATNTDAAVAAAVSASHARAHSITGTSDHTSAATAGKILKADASGLPIDATNTDADVASAVSLKHTQGSDTGTSNATFAVGDLKFFGKSIQLADHAVQVLTTATANYPSHGFVQVCTTSVMTESAEFEMGSDGNVNIIRGTANVVANVSTTGKFCLGTVAAQNPLTIMNHLEATVQAIIQFWHV